MWELDATHVIHDSLHGQIRLTEEEMKVVDHPLFQRLHGIKQTSLLHYVWPGATHARFDHSIGVMHLADLLLGGVIRRSLASKEKLRAMDDAEPGQAVRLSDLKQADPKMWTALRRLVRLTALVHDIGHGPLSHLFDAFAPWRTDIAKFLEEKHFDPSRELVRAHFASAPGERVDHEAMSAIFFTIICHDLKLPSWIATVVGAVLLDRPTSEAEAQLASSEMSGLAPFITFIRDLISSAPVDADRMDYLARDSKFAGVAYGAYDIERLLKSALCVRDTGAVTAYRLGWRMSGLRAVEHFVHARFQMFAQVYYHKTNHVIIAQLASIASAAQAERLSIMQATTPESLVNAYTRLSDETFLRTLAGEMRPGFPDSMRIRTESSHLLARHLWKCVIEFDREDAEHADAFLEKLRAIHHEVHLFVDRMPLKATKDLDRGAYLLSLDQTRRYHQRPGNHTWLEASPLMRTLRDDERSIVRLFAATGDATSPDAIKRAKDIAFDLAHTFPLFQRQRNHDSPNGGWET
jgi:HD superfamily phosphohydrolase